MEELLLQKIGSEKNLLVSVTSKTESNRGKYGTVRSYSSLIAPAQTWKTIELTESLSCWMKVGSKATVP